MSTDRRGHDHEGGAVGTAVRVRLTPAPPRLPPAAALHDTGPPALLLAAGDRAARPLARPDRAVTRARPTVTGAAPELDPRQACCMVALAAVEVLAGRRPLAQLARWLTPEVYDRLARRAALTAPGTRVLDAAAAARAPAAEPTEPGTTGVARRPSVRRVRVHRVDAHTVEASVVIAHADRVRAVAVRLTRSTGRWRADALEVG